MNLDELAWIAIGPVMLVLASGSRRSATSHRPAGDAPLVTLGGRRGWQSHPPPSGAFLAR